MATEKTPSVTPELQKKLTQVRQDLENGELPVFESASDAQKWMDSL